MHPCVPFRSGAPLAFFGAPQLKSTDLERLLGRLHPQTIRQIVCRFNNSDI